jgi:2-dehydro-3-deoxyglucarate aldolase
MTDSLGARFRARESLVGAWVSVGHPVVAEVLAAEPVDFVVLDGEHSENDLGDLAACVRAVDAANKRTAEVDDSVSGRDEGGTTTASVVRASGPDRAEIRRLLDLGADGILVPQIESLADAEEAVRASQYPPDGVRGVAGTRASNYGTDLESTVASANDDVATILQIETTGAVDAVDDIAALDGLDGLFVGPADLSARLGDFGGFDTESFTAAVDGVRAAADAAGVSVGSLSTSHENTPIRKRDWEMDFLVAGVDVDYLRRGLDGYLDALPSEVE